MSKLLILLFLASGLVQEHEFDKYYNMINAYELRYKGAGIFSESDKFINNFGLPDSLEIGWEIVHCKDKNEFFKVLEHADFIPTAYYGKQQYMFVGKDYIIPSLLDFIESDLEIHLGDICFSSDYSLKNFMNDFPKSYMNPAGNLSFFKFHKINANESRIDSFFLTRNSKDNPSSRQIIEIVFLDGRLGYIVFNNF